MEVTDKEAERIKSIYDGYYTGEVSAEEALADLEQLINGDDEDVCDECGHAHDEPENTAMSVLEKE